MLTTGTLILWLVMALLGTAAWQLFGKIWLGSQARDRRRRQRNYRRVVSRRQRPTVRLAVNVGR
jgi:hypothetical protein